VQSCRQRLDLSELFEPLPVAILVDSDLRI
jgi:hypothetical protein